MGLKLQAVSARQGWTWARDGVRLYLRRPVAFSAMLVLFLLASGLWSVLPVVGVAALASLPLLSLGFMVASRSVLRGGPAHPGQFVEPLMADARRRRSLLVLCGLYGVGALLVVLWAGWVYGDALDALREAMAKHGPSSPEAAQAAADPRLTQGTLVLALLATALSIPFWHAPALVWWGGQGVWQALFSSTLGVWRAKAAYLVYSLAWLLASMALSLLVGLLAGVIGAPAILTWLVPALVLALSAAFYVSLWFSFVDNFGSPTTACRPNPCPTSPDQAAAPESGLQPAPALYTSRHAAAVSRPAQAIGVSLATDSASHLAPWRPKLTCARASSPWPSSVTITPSPNLLWNTLWPMRSAGPAGVGATLRRGIDRRRGAAPRGPRRPPSRGRCRAPRPPGTRAR